MIPQNIKNLLGEVGESSVLLRLFFHLKDTGWNPYRNISEKGCDIILLPENVGSSDINNFKIIKIEVKTRQKLDAVKQAAQFDLTENEYKNSDFLIAFWFELNKYFIVPVNKLKEYSSKGKLIYRFLVSKNQIDDVNHECHKYRDNWQLLNNAMTMTYNDWLDIN